MKSSSLVLACASAFVFTPRSAAAADWEPPVAVSQSCCGAYFPFAMHDEAGTHHLWWVEVDEGMDARWRLRHARGSGGVFMPAQEIGGQLDARVIDGVHAGATLSLVFSAFRVHYGDGCMPGGTAGCSDLYFIESLDGGASWSSPQALPHADDPVQRYEPVIVREAGGALVVAHDRDGTIHTFTRDPGGVWGAETMITGLYAGQQHSPRLAATSSGLHLLLRARPDGQDGDVLLHTRRDGDVWTEPKPIAPLVGGAQLSSIASDGAQRLQVAFQTSSAGEYAVYFSESLDAGGTWSAPVQLSGPGYAARPTITRELGGSTVHVVWDRGSTIGHAEASGGGFTPELSLSAGLEKSLEAHISAGANELLAVWHGRITADAPYQIFATRRAPTDPVPVDPTTGGDDASSTSSGDPSSGDTTAGTGETGTTTLSEGTGEVPTGEPPATTSSSGEPPGSETGEGASEGDGGCGCNTTIGAPWWLALAVLWRRRRLA